MPRKEVYHKYKEQTIKYNKEYFQKNKKRIVNRNYIKKLKKKYNLSYEQYLKILEVQGNKCAICKNELGIDRNHIHVDHCHKTGKIRGILCRYCNSTLGYSKEDKNRLEACIEYLKIHE